MKLAYKELGTLSMKLDVAEKDLKRAHASLIGAQKNFDIEDLAIKDMLKLDAIPLSVYGESRHRRDNYSNVISSLKETINKQESAIVVIQKLKQEQRTRYEGLVEQLKNCKGELLEFKR